MKSSPSNSNCLMSLKILSAYLGCAKEKLNEDSNYLFRFVITIKDAQKKTKESQKSQKVFLTEGEMIFKDNEIVFNSVDINSDLLEITMAVGNNFTGKKFNPNLFTIKTLKHNEDVQVVLQLTYKSYVKLIYRLSECLTMTRNPTVHTDHTSMTRNPTVHTDHTSMTRNPTVPTEANMIYKKVNKEHVPNRRTAKNSALNSSYIGEKSSNFLDTSINIGVNSSFIETSPSEKTSDSLPVNVNLKEKVKFFESSASNSSNARSSLKSEGNDHKRNISSIVSIKESTAPFKRGETVSSQILDFGDMTNRSQMSKTMINNDIQSYRDYQPSRYSFEKELSFFNDKVRNNSISNEDVIFLTYQKRELNIKEIPPNSFCEAFFICSTPFDNAKIIEGSEQFLAHCTHSECSILPSTKAEILCRFPLKDSKRIELNNLAATLCFPTGVKVCYHQDETNKKSVKNYSTSITHQDGSRFYMMTYHYYQKIYNADYIKSYSTHALKEFMKFGLDKLENIKQTNSSERKTVQQIEKDLEICEKFGFADYVYVPFCACLISKYPYTHQMEKCIESILRMSNDENRKIEEVADLIVQLTRGIPIPPINKSLKFFIPLTPHPIELNAPVYKDLNIINNNLINLLQLFSIDNIITVYRLILFEQKILFVDEDYHRLSQVIDSFICLLYPIEWIHTYIPIISEEMIKYFQSFMPFIMGINESMMNVARTSLYEEENIYIVYINKNYIDISNNKKGKKLKIKEILTIPEFPSHIENKITREIKALKKDIEKTNLKELDRYAIEMNIRDIFIESFVELFHDYMSYLCFIEDYAVFNTEMLIENRNHSMSDFYREITETQNFQQFVQSNSKENLKYFNMMLKKYNEGRGPHRTNVRSTSAINVRKSSSVSPHKRSLKISPERLSSLNLNIQEKYFEVEQTYVIAPYFISTKINNLDDLEKIINDSYCFPENFLNSNGILREDKRIFTRLQLLKEENFPSSYMRYTIPGEALKEESKLNEINKDVVISSSIASKLDFFEKSAKEQAQKRKCTMISKTKLRKEDEMSEKEQESVKEGIKEYLGKIFTSEKLSDYEIQNLLTLLETSFGREYLIRILYQSKFKDNYFQTLSDQSFLDMHKVLFNILLNAGKLEEVDVNLEYGILLTKSSFYYAKAINKKGLYFIYEELAKKKGAFPIWKREKFWIKWFELEQKEKIGTKVNDSKSSPIMEGLKNLAIRMNMLKIEHPFILRIIFDEIGNKYFPNDDAKKNLKSQISKLINLNFVK